MAQVFVSIGSNIDRERNIALALQMLQDNFGNLHSSSVYESDAVGFDSAPFYNLVVGFNSSEPPERIQAMLHRIEDDCGRARSGELSARTLDLDLLLYDDLVLQQGRLHLPRPDILRYAFVLRPLAEIAPQLRHPVNGETYARLWEGFSDSRQVLSRVDWPPQA